MIDLFAGCDECLEEWSPVQLLLKKPELFKQLPSAEIFLYHGVRDKTVPVVQTKLTVSVYAIRWEIWTVCSMRTPKWHAA